MHVISLEEESGTNIVLYLYKKLRNAKALREKILSRQLNCCAVKSSLIIDPMQIYVAAKKAVLSKNSGKLITRSLNSELLHNLSVNKYISQTLGQFGIGENDENILIVVFQERGNYKFCDIKSEVEGEECNISEISNFSDIELIKKTYKITELELQVSTLVDSVISRISTKEFGF